MSKTATNDSFEFERLLKALMPYISEESKKILQQWNSCSEACKAAWALFSAYSSEENGVDAKLKFDELFAMEDSVNDTISIIFLEIPDPASASGKWDGGQEQAEIREREKNTIAMKKLTSERYAELRTQLKSIVKVEKDLAIAKQNGENQLQNQEISNEEKAVKDYEAIVSEIIASKDPEDKNTEPKTIESEKIESNGSESENLMDDATNGVAEKNKLNGKNSSGLTDENANGVQSIRDFDDIFDDDIV